VKGLVGTIDTGEVEAEPGCSAAADLRTCTSGDGERVPVQLSLERQASGDSMTMWDGD
jgi:hypothetical protein